MRWADDTPPADPLHDILHIPHHHPANRRHYEEPPTNRARLEPLGGARGFTGLSRHKKLKLLTHAQVLSGLDLEQVLLTLLDQEKSDRYSHFVRVVMPLLKLRSDRAFNGFCYTEKFVEELCEVKLTGAYADDWWHCPTGHQMRRSKEDVRQINQLARSLQDPALQLQVSANNLSRLNTKAPSPITDMEELLNFLQRTWHCMNLFFPHAFIGELAHQLYLGLIKGNLSATLARDADWMRSKPGEILWMLIQAHEEEFSHTVTEDDFCNAVQDGFALPFYRRPPIEQMVAAITGPQRTVIEGALPLELRPIPSAAIHQPGSTNPGGPRRRSTNPPDGPTQPEGDTPPDAPNRANTDNPQWHRSFRHFFTNTVPLNRRREGIAQWLQAANSTTQQCVLDLGLPNDACGRFHIMGTCTRRNCRGHALPAANFPSGPVETIVRRLTDGLNSTQPQQQGNRDRNQRR